MSWLPTVRQTQVLRLIAAYAADNGFPPSHRDLREAMGVTSTNAVADNLRALERKGMIRTRPMISRGTVLTDKGREWLAIEAPAPEGVTP